MAECEKYLLKKFCYCGSLRTGTLLAGIGAIILSIFTIIIIALTMAGLINIEIRMVVLDSFLSDFVIQIILIINLCMTLILSILLVIGTVKRNVYLMMPWVLLGGFLIIGLIISIIITVVNFYSADDIFNGTLWLVVGLITFVIYTYFWYVSYSFFYEVYKEAKRGSYTKDPFRRKW